MMTMKEAHAEAMNWTLGELAIVIARDMVSHGLNPIKKEFTPMLSIKMMEFAKESGAEPGDCALAMINYLSAVILQATFDNDEANNKSGQ